MAAFNARRLSAQVLRRWLWAAMLAASTAAPAIAAESVVISLDQARILKLPDRAATVVIGNPLIADLSVQPGGVAVVTGKGFGRTNIVAMDRTGAVLMERTIQVAAAAAKHRRGLSRRRTGHLQLHARFASRASCSAMCRPSSTKPSTRSARRNALAVGAARGPR